MRRTKTSLRQTDNIEALLEKLGSLQIMNEALEETYEWSDKEISVAPVPVTMNDNTQAIMPKSIVLDPGWFDRNQTKFENW